MDVTAGQTVLRADAQPDQPLRGGGVIAVAALAYLGIAYAFAFIDRGIGRFGFETLLWTAWTALGFGVRLAWPERVTLRQRVARVMLVLTGLLWIVPAFLAFNLIRWMAVGLLVVLAARAAVLATRRDLYYLLAALIAIAMLILTHPKAQWPVWFYLGPAWLAIGLVLAWDYAAGLPVPPWMKIAGTALFMLASLLVTAAALALLPRPAVLGFGFMPPGTTTPGRLRVDTPQGPPSRREGLQPDARGDVPVAGGGAQPGDGAGRMPGQQAGAGTRPGTGSGGSGPGAGSGTSGGRQDGPLPGPQGGGIPMDGTGGAMDRAIDALDAALNDKHLPDWQRSVISQLRGALQALSGKGQEDNCQGGPQADLCMPGQQPGPPSPDGQTPGAKGRQPPDDMKNAHAEQRKASPQGEPVAGGAGGPRILDPWLLILLLAAFLWLLSRRWQLATSGALMAAWLLRRHAPAQSLRCGMVALRCLLRTRGHRLAPGMSLAELVDGATRVPPPVRAWLRGAVQTYGLSRFGGRTPTPDQADHVRSAVAAAAEVLVRPPATTLGQKAS